MFLFVPRQNGAMRGVIAILERHAAIPAVVENACWSLHHLAIPRSVEDADAPAAPGADASAASALLVRSEQIAAHASLAFVSEAMMWAIASLPVSPDGTGARAFERATLRIITALTTHAAHAGVVEGALWALVR